jgi:hypothetical protein
MLKSDFDLCEEAESEILRLKKHLENQNKTKTIRWNPMESEIPTRFRSNVENVSNAQQKDDLMAISIYLRS